MSHLHVVQAPPGWWRTDAAREAEEEEKKEEKEEEERKPIRKEELGIGKKVAFLLYNVLSEVECRHIIERTEEMGYRPMPEYDKAYRSNTRVIVDDVDLTQEIWRRIEPFIPPTFTNSRGDWAPYGLNPRWRFCRYTPGQHFSSHTDGCFEKSFSDRSQLTMMLYLSSSKEFGGGATVFLEGRHVEVSPEAGMALVFQHNILHEGQRVQSGKKYIMRSDVMYRRYPDPQPAATEDLSFYDDYGI